MPSTDELTPWGTPTIDLPEDMGDGPFFTGPADSNAIGARPAASSERFRRTEPFSDNIMTDNALLGPSSHITVGLFHVSDMLRPNSFRRVIQSFTHRPSPDLNGTFEIRFTGAGEAIIRQHAHALASGVGALANAALALDDGALIPTPTLYAHSTTFQIRLRMPGYEPSRFGGIQVPDPNCFDGTSEVGRRVVSANRIEEFSFGNSPRERKVIPVPYPVGQSIPVVFDIVNHNPTHNIIVDFYVEVLIDRTAQNQQRADEEAAAVEARPARPPATDPHVPIGQVSSARPDGLRGSIPVGSETNTLDVIADRNSSDWD